MRLLTWILIGLAWAGPLAAEPLKPIERPQGERIRLVEGVWACHLGFGVPADWLAIEGETLANTDQQTLGWSGLNLGRAGYLGFGCLLEGFYLDYHFADRAFLLAEPVEAEGVSWTSLSYRLDQLTLGKSLSLAAHRLYLDFGLGGFVGSYRLGRPQAGGETQSSVYKDSGALAQARLRLHLGRHLFLSYGLSGSSRLAALSARAGLNFMMRY